MQQSTNTLAANIDQIASFDWKLESHLAVEMAVRNGELAHWCEGDNEVTFRHIHSDTPILCGLGNLHFFARLTFSRRIAIVLRLGAWVFDS